MFKKRIRRKSDETKISYSVSEDRKKLSPHLQENIHSITESFVQTGDLVQREIDHIGTLIFIDTLVDKEKIETIIIQGLNKSDDILLKAQKIDNLDDLNVQLLNGYSILLQENKEFAYIFSTSGLTDRAIQEPSSEHIIRGSHDGFIESLSTNIQMVRRVAKNEKLVVKYMEFGERSNTKIAIVYIDNLINKEVLKELEYRLSYSKVGYIQSPGYLLEFIEDESFSPFPQMLSTERPDRVVANLMEGRFALLADSSPIALIAPINFFAFFQSPDDYNIRFFIGSFLTMIRLLSLYIALVLPGVYIAVVSFHYEVVPYEFMLTLKGTLEYVPIPPIIEALSMAIILELLSEAATRLPSPIAQTIGVVGGLVIGSAVVEANLVSNSMIIVIALTAIASYTIPVNEMSSTIRLLGFPISIAASLFGFIGIAFALMIILIHLCKLESFGQPYFSPLAPFKLEENKDTFFRFPIWTMKKRPSTTRSQDVRRMGNPRGWKKNE
ncbi:spore germination protein [Bacillus sp. CGMCC 1.16607]|uniref:spore germination protein n=1 Tax=Bacillus sp. CGMCC 1.16607 TaxID=3351842 RepID=UPI003641C990